MKRTFNFIFVIVFVLIFLFIGHLVYNRWFNSDIEQFVRKGAPFGVLLLGEDVRSGGFKKITFICVAVINPKLSRIGFISFLPKIRISEEIASMEELAVLNDGIQKVKEVIAKVISLKIPFFIHFKVSDVSRAIDLLEGLPYFLSKSDTLKGEELPVGEFFLDGSMVSSLLNIRVDHEHASAYQVDRYYNLILNAWGLRKKKWEMLQEEIIFDRATANLRTNFSHKELYKITKLFFSNEQWLPLLFEMPLKKEKNLYLLNKEAAAIHFRDFLASLTQEKNSIFEIPPSVEIRNGTEIHNLAKRVGSELTRKGFRVFEFTNADRHDHKETILLDVSGKFFYLKSVAKDLNITRYYHAVDRTQFTDLVFILGEDFSKTLVDLRK